MSARTCPCIVDGKKCNRPLREGEKRCPHCQARLNNKLKKGAAVVVTGVLVVFRKKLKEGAIWVGKKAAKAAKDNWPLIRDTLKQYIPF